MKNAKYFSMAPGAIGVAMLMICSAAGAQDSQERPTLNKDKQPAQQQPASTTLSLDTPATPPASSEEDTALKAIQAMPEGSVANLQAKIDATEAFIQKFPQSRYRSMAYGFLTVSYTQVGKSDKSMDYGEKELELNPNDVATMAKIGRASCRERV